MIGLSPGEHVDTSTLQPLNTAITSSRMMRLSTYVLVLVVVLLAGRPAAAQEGGAAPVPRNEDAELVFDQALEAFEQGDYGMAYRRFRLVVQDYPLHRKTTAAMLMAGKSLYRSGEYDRAIDVLNRLIEQYPSSSYLDEARRTRRFARQQMDRAEETREVIRLGVLLPSAEGDNTTRTQALFNGVRLAVDELSGAGGKPIQMIYRSTGSSASAARQAAEELVRQEVDAIVGPLFSEAAVAAGRVAEEAGVVMVAPLATDPAVSRNRRHVFQANPTIAMRGRQMARFVNSSLITIDAVGVAAEEGNAASEQMAESFREAWRQTGNELAFYKLVPGESGWRDLPNQLGSDSMQEVDAIYLPIVGSNATQLIGAALAGLEQVDERVRVLGNSAWHDLPFKQQASLFNTTYARVFYVDGGEGAKQFRQRYSALAGHAPRREVVERLAFTGYDVARFLLTTLQGQSGRPLHEALRQRSTYQGIGIRLNFGAGNVNEALYYLRYRNGQIQLLR